MAFRFYQPNSISHLTAFIPPLFVAWSGELVTSQGARFGRHRMAIHEDDRCLGRPCDFDWADSSLDRSRRHPPRYAAYLIPSSPRYPHSSFTHCDAAIVTAQA